MILILFFLLFLSFSLSPYFPVKVRPTAPKPLSELCEEIIIKNYQNYDENAKEEILYCLSAVLQVSIKKEQKPQEQIEESLCLGQKIDFITLAFQSTRMRRHQALLLEVAKHVPSKYINPGMALYRNLEEISSKVDIIVDIEKILNAIDKYDLESLARTYNQTEIEALIAEKNYNDLIKKYFWQSLYNWFYKKNNLAEIQFFLDKGVSASDPEPYDKNNFTPLHLAAAGDSQEIAHLLLSKGADTASQNSTERWGLVTPLELAIIWNYKPCPGGPELSKTQCEALEQNFESKREICTLIASKSSLEILGHSYNETFKFLPESSSIKLFLKEQMVLKSQK